MEVLEKGRCIRPFIELANRPVFIGKWWEGPKLKQSGMPEPPKRWSTASEIEEYREARERRLETLRNQRQELEDERAWMRILLRELAELPKPETVPPPEAPTLEIPESLGQRQQLVLDARNRIRVEPVFPEIAALRRDFLQALNGIDATKVRECSICQKVYWAGRIDKPACSKRCGGTLRSRNDYEKKKVEREAARRLRLAGKSIREIARELGLSIKKVRNYVAAAAAVVPLKNRRERKG